MSNFLDPRLPDRFWNKVQPCPMSGCWIWVGTSSPNGYGCISIGGKSRSVHRLAYETLFGPIAPGLHIDHRCRVRCCCNPLHLEPVTPMENIRRGETSKWQRDKTHCPHGHEYSEENTYRYVRKDGTSERQCRACIKERSLNRPVTVAVVVGIGTHSWPGYEPQKLLKVVG